MPEVLLATCSLWPDGEPGGATVLPDAFAELGYDARWADWATHEDWSADLVCVRSVWDYEARVPDFLDWARRTPQLLNGADVFAWNLDKSYLLDLAREGLPVIPTLVAADRTALADAVASYSTAVVKPVVGAGGRGLVVLDRPGVEVPGDGPWLVQPLVDTVRTTGEHSVFVFGGRAVSQVRKLPGGEEIRVHEEYGGRSVPVPVDPAAAELATTAVATAERLTGGRLTYARADMLLREGAWVLGELEVTEPGLYLDVVPENAVAFARAAVAVAARTA